MLTRAPTIAAQNEGLEYSNDVCLRTVLSKRRHFLYIKRHGDVLRMKIRMRSRNDGRRTVYIYKRWDNESIYHVSCVIC
jgi:hypothetical protein